MQMGRHPKVTAHPRIRVVSESLSLSAQSEALDQRAVAVDVDVRQVAEKTTTLANQQKQATT